MSLIEEIKEVIKKYDQSKDYKRWNGLEYTYADFVDLSEEVFNHYPHNHRIVLVLPLEWKKTMVIYPVPGGILSYYGKAYSVLGRPSTSEPLNKIFFDVETPHGVLDMLVFANVDSPKHYSARG